MAKPHQKNPRVNALNLAEVHILDDSGIADCGIGRTLNGFRSRNFIGNPFSHRTGSGS